MTIGADVAANVPIESTIVSTDNRPNQRTQRAEGEGLHEVHDAGSTSFNVVNTPVTNRFSPGAQGTSVGSTLQPVDENHPDMSMSSRASRLVGSLVRGFISATPARAAFELGQTIGRMLNAIRERFSRGDQGLDLAIADVGDHETFEHDVEGDASFTTRPSNASTIETSDPAETDENIDTSAEFISPGSTDDPNATGWISTEANNEETPSSSLDASAQWFDQEEVGDGSATTMANLKASRRTLGGDDDPDQPEVDVAPSADFNDLRANLIKAGGTNQVDFGPLRRLLRTADQEQSTSGSGRISAQTASRMFEMAAARLFSAEQEAASVGGSVDPAIKGALSDIMNAAKARLSESEAAPVQEGEIYPAVANERTEKLDDDQVLRNHSEALGNFVSSFAELTDTRSLYDSVKWNQSYLGIGEKLDIHRAQHLHALASSAREEVALLDKNDPQLQRSGHSPDELDQQLKEIQEFCESRMYLDV